MSQANTPRVLCVDDEPRVLEGLERTLYEHFDVTTSSDPLKALELLERSERPFAVVVSDMRMPQLDGAAFLARVRKITPNTTRLLLTGQVDVQGAIAAVNEGAIFRFLCKPCPREQLLGAIEAAVEQHRLVIAEQELLERTLTSTIGLLSEILSLLAPALFARTQRIRACMTHLAQKLELPNRWRFDLAASLCMIGCVGLPEQTLERVLSGNKLNADERRTFDEHPATAYRLLSKIPRFEQIAEMIRRQVPTLSMQAPDPDAELGAAMLRVARDFDQLLERKTPFADALALMKRRASEEERPIVNALEDFQPPDMGNVRLMKITQMAAHMVLEDDVRTTTGVVVIPRGRVLNMVMLERLWNFQGTLVEPIRVRVPG